MFEAKIIRRCACVAYLFFLFAGHGDAAALKGGEDWTELVSDVVFYNCENLFDTIDNPLTHDEEYTPIGERHWTGFRQYEKMLNIARVLVAAGEGQPPILVGLAEVENDSVVHRLTHGTPLREWDYKYVITHSDDARGINVALLYQPMEFRLIGHEPIKIVMPEGARSTRDLLHVWGRIVNTDTLDVIVCHLPSQLGGARQSAPNRHAALQTLSDHVDSVLSVRLHPHVLVMGDMNESPSSKNLRRLPLFDKSLDNLMAPLQRDLTRGRRSVGSHKYHGKWSFLDQFWCNRPHYSDTDEKEKPNTRGTSVWVDCVEVVVFPFMLTEDDTHLGHRPLRSYYGYRYEGGFSDHLPIKLKLHVRY